MGEIQWTEMETKYLLIKGSRWPSCMVKEMKHVRKGACACVNQRISKYGEEPWDRALRELESTRKYDAADMV